MDYQARIAAFKAQSAHVRAAREASFERNKGPSFSSVVTSRPVPRPLSSDAISTIAIPPLKLGFTSKPPLSAPKSSAAFSYAPELYSTARASHSAGRSSRGWSNTHPTTADEFSMDIAPALSLLVDLERIDSRLRAYESISVSAAAAGLLSALPRSQAPARAPVKGTEGDVIQATKSDSARSTTTDGFTQTDSIIGEPIFRREIAASCVPGFSLARGTPQEAITTTERGDDTLARPAATTTTYDSLVETTGSDMHSLLPRSIVDRLLLNPLPRRVLGACVTTTTAAQSAPLADELSSVLTRQRSGSVRYETPSTVGDRCTCVECGGSGATKSVPEAATVEPVGNYDTDNRENARYPTSGIMGYVKGVGRAEQFLAGQSSLRSSSRGRSGSVSSSSHYSHTRASSSSSSLRPPWRPACAPLSRNDGSASFVLPPASSAVRSVVRGPSGERVATRRR